MSWAPQIVAQQGFIYDSVTDFVQQAQRTKHFTKRNSLDQLSEIWIGPAVQEDAFVPAIGTQHPVYKLMTVISCEVRRFINNCGVVSQVTINYQGKMINTPSGKYVSAPTYDTYWSEGEVSWEVNSEISGAPQFIPTGQSLYAAGIMGTGATGVPSGPGSYIAPYYNVGQWVYPTVKGVQQYSRRYIGKGVRLGYITNARPSGSPSQPNKLPANYLGFALVYDIRGPFQPGNQSPFNDQSIVSEILCTDVSVSDSADGWYQVTETYQSRMYVQG